MTALSSVIYLFLSTTPLLAVYSYFIYLSILRPRVLEEQLQNAADMNDNSLISLDAIMNTFLSTIVLWSSLAAYLLFFVRRRRQLKQKYLDQDEASIVIGNVFYSRRGGKIWNKLHHTDIAYVTYPNPNDDRIVEKMIHTYHPYHRENVSIAILHGFPLSGQPVADVERDMMSYQSEHAVRHRDKITQMLVVCFVWIVFCIVGSLVVLKQMGIIANEIVAEQNYKEDLDFAWITFWIVLFVVAPLLSIGSNVIHWNLYRNWLLKTGSVVLESKKVPPNSIQPDDLHNDEEGGFSLF